MSAIADFMINAIADAVIDILAGNASLDDVQLFIRGGAPLEIPLDKHPYVEVIIGQEVPEGPYTGALYTCTYNGLVTFTAHLGAQGAADWLVLSGDDQRRANVTSYDLIKRLVMTAQMELQRTEHCSLDDLQTSLTLDNLTLDEIVRVFSVDGPIIYGLDNRINNYENFGSIPFTVSTQRLVESTT